MMKAIALFILLIAASLDLTYAEIICRRVTKTLPPQGEDAAFSFKASGENRVLSYYMFDDYADKAARYLKVVENAVKSKSPVKLTIKEGDVKEVSATCK